MDDLIISWAKEIQALAQNGLAYSNNRFDIERYERLREISIEMVEEKTDVNKDIIKDLFASDLGYQTPKMDSRAAIFVDDKILMVKELNNKWSLPGGWVDEDQTVVENTIKEAWEEAGVRVKYNKLIAVLDRNRHNRPKYINNITKFFVLCDYIDGSFKKNLETIESGFFTREDLINLEVDNNKNTLKQIDLCFEAKDQENWKVVID